MEAQLPRTMLRARRHVERCPANGKIRYRTKGKALKFRERSSQIIRRSLSVYHCDHCDGWHLTKQRPKASA